MIRYYCHTDAHGPRADLCARYAEAFVAIGETVRVIPVEQVHASATPPGVEHRWKHLRSLFLTPVSGNFVNVICSHPFWWSRLFTVGVRNVLVTLETPSSALALHSQVPSSAQMAAGPKTDLVDGEKHTFEVFEIPHELPDPRTVALRFDAIVTPKQAVAEEWQSLIDGATTLVDNGEECERVPCQVFVVGLDLAERAQALRKAVAIG